MVEGAFIGEDETDTDLATPVMAFLENVMNGAADALHERYGGDNIVYDPVAHCVQYYLSHGKFPETADASCIAKAKTALAAGLRGSSGNKATHGTFH